ncbi:DNA adenine methylase [Pseudohalocynthiibacter aestuariivivens]|uniref:site-specific DNA-methyltransferase (adenine-specific) n=1 Tax=Pseudohalocynthiibacter aestuariivivens TaxID=1591409 RepID=A0ABV5JCC0_9RHOB|nr:DNA adenine methylase [Pseudohalocynthiibacter aestuariivivens]MBS9718542.1 DNA adenine methylase [Pseudohalocynthiibacter aestuariivivens]
MEQVRAAAPVAPWLGGKKQLSKTLIERIDAIPHATYVEPFVGMGGVFLRRSWKPKAEVINDLNGEIINLFRILQRHYPQFMDCLKFQVSSRREFERLRQTDPATLTDLERAARFIYLQRQNFGGKRDGVFGVATGRASRFDLSRLGPLLEAAHERLSGVVFENLDWSELITRYDAKDTLFYLDPPYFGGENDYGKGMFDRGAYTQMAEQLSSIEGAFLMSINDKPEIREVFAPFIIDEVRLSYTISKGKSGGKVQELIISNRSTVAGLL